MKFQILLIPIILLASCATEINQPLVAKKILETTSGSIGIYDYQGIAPLFEQKNDTTYVINFWATWCAPCVAELPYFDELLEKYKNEKIAVKLVSLDFANQLDISLLPFLKKKQIKSDILILDDNDANNWINKVHPTWSGALPATVIYKNSTKAFFEKSFTFEALETEFLKIKNKK